MKHILITTSAAMLLVGCASSPTVTIHSSVQGGNITKVEQLLAEGTDINQTDDSKWTPLHVAAQYGQKEILELLLSKGASVDAKDLWGKTPLNRAAGFGHKTIM